MAIKEVRAKIVGVSPYSQSRPIATAKHTGEAGDAYEERTWRERMHVNDAGEVFLPPMCVKNCLADVARYLSESVPGKGKATYTKHFEAGLMIVTTWTLTSGGKPFLAKDVPGERLYVPSDGRKGGPKRVWRTFPLLWPWEAEGTLVLMDPILIDKPEKVREYLEHAGKFIGIGRFRPRNGGFYGRFSVASFK